MPRNRPKKNLSEYAIALAEKREIKNEYGVSGKPEKLELRLDSVVYRLGFSLSRKGARQLVSHQHILLNNKKVNIPSIKIKIGDKISLRNSRLLPLDFKKHKIPIFVKMDPKSLTAEIVNLPRPETGVKRVKKLTALKNERQ